MFDCSFTGVQSREPDWSRKKTARPTTSPDTTSASVGAGVATPKFCSGSKLGVSCKLFGTCAGTTHRSCESKLAATWRKPLPVATSTEIAEAKPTMAARPSHTSAPPPPCFALCSHRMDSALPALEKTRLLLEVTRSEHAAAF